jgi:toxin-antitoxin system PIN domain toxin
VTGVLLDVNVLIALAWPSHVHHRRATAWFAERRPAAFATCPATQAGFLRVSSNRTMLPDAKSPREALALLREIVAMRGHVFWEDGTNFAASRFIASDRIIGHRQVTDAHVLAIALAHHGRLATFDAGIRDLVPSKFAAESVEVIG